MFGLFETKEEKITNKLLNYIEHWKDPNTVKNLVKLLGWVLLNFKKDFDFDKEFKKIDTLKLVKHWTALNCQLFLGNLAKLGDFELYTEIRKKFKFDSEVKEVSNLINNNYAPIYSNINSDWGWALMAEEMIYHCWGIKKEIGINDAFNDFHKELNELVFKEHVIYKKFFEKL